MDTEATRRAAAASEERAELLLKQVAELEEGVARAEEGVARAEEGVVRAEEGVVRAEEGGVRAEEVHVLQVQEVDQLQAVLMVHIHVCMYVYI